MSNSPDSAQPTLFDPALVGRDWRTTLRTVTLYSPMWSLGAPANPRRVALIVASQGNAVFFWSTDPTINTLAGIAINPTQNGQRLELVYALHGGLVQADMYFTVPGGSGYISMIETFWSPIG